MQKSAIIVLLCALSAGAADQPGLRVAVRNPLAVLDRDNLVLAFDLAAVNDAAQPLTLRSIDYTVSVEGLPLFSGALQGFQVPAGQERVVALGGSGGEGRKLLARLAQTARFNYRVSGTLHGSSASGELIEQAFATAGTCPTPEQLPKAQPRAALLHSLLDY